MAPMAKKKYSSKKHRNRPLADGAVHESASTVAEAPSPQSAPARPKTAATVASKDFSYVAQDLRRIGLMAVSLIALELVLWYLVSHTGLGDSVYNLIKL